MRLLIIRHAAAVPSGTPGVAEDARPLTPRGRERFRVAARGLARIAHRPDVLLTSPLPRAHATAEIAARAFRRLEPVVEPALAHGSLAEVIAALARQPADSLVAIVGHEPVVSGLLARLLRAGAGEQLAFKKGGAALVDLPDGARGA
ncbi:MAG TPA: phosphoglycerate mutase family protein, partial [Actinomycetota bacterium]|nr:phosphoglycerate mutase family protein [Actinomycetota bacterium]